ncbi:MAG: phosphatidylserine decarboxylase-domain-containing protein [Benjaminiella poitrasii]|nr:MAG: phosphatidylserine decarboxylase-domain-containing protein [Benjaminiella poitrasii]
MIAAELVLKVDIIRGRNISREDETNIPNPYANVRCGGIRQRTDTIKKSTDPEWLCSFEFNLSNDIIGHKRRRRAFKKQGLSIAVFSKDRFSSIFLGKVSWSLDRLFPPQSSLGFEDNIAEWFPLSHTSRQYKRFHLRRRREDVDNSNSLSETEQAEICVQYGLIHKNEQGVVLPTDTALLQEDWQFLLQENNHSHEEEEHHHQQQTVLTEEPSFLSTTPPHPVMHESLSTTSFSSRFKRPMKKVSSVSSIVSLTSSSHPGTPQLAKRRLRNKFRREQRKSGGYAKFYSDVMGITFLEIESAKDLPPERNMTRTGFDMDPFVIVSYGASTFRTRAIRHNLNPIWNEKLFFHVRNTQGNYKIKFAVYDKDKFSNNDFVASQEITISDVIQKMPSSIHDTGPDSINPSDEIEHNMGRHTIPLTLAKPEKWKDSCRPTLTFRAKFVPYLEIRKMFWVALAKTCDADNSNSLSRLEVQTMLEALGSNISESTLDHFWVEHGKVPSEDLTMDELVKSLESFLLSVEDKQANEDVIIEEDNSLPVSVSESTTINPFFLADDDDDEDYDDDEDDIGEEDDEDEESEEGDYCTSFDDDDMDMIPSSSATTVAPPTPDEADYEALAEGDGIQYVDGPLRELRLQDDNESKTEEEHKAKQEKVIRLTECPICHKPNLSKRGQMDIVTHVATCAANDWTTVDRFLISNFGSEAQAQRKWFVKLVNSVGYGRYSIGKNNANIIVQDRLTGQLIDERMSVYVRLGMRLIYKGMRTGIQSKTAKKILANMSYRQGRRFDDPLSKREIRSFIKFHQLDMSEVQEPIESFRTFNEFFYRKLKPGSRPCDFPDNKKVTVSPADCRMMAFPTIDNATKIWIKGIDFSLSKLLDDAEEAKRFEGGALAIFRLAPQDYHRYHSPVDGVVSKIHKVKGQYFTVNPMAIRTTLDVYGENKRDIVYMDSDEFGRVAIACIGAMMVGSNILTAGVGDYLERTDELGYFAFGGSTLVVLFEKNTVRFDEDLLENATNSLETLVRVGSHIGIHP